MAKVASFNFKPIGVCRLMWSSCWRDKTPWSDDGVDLPYFMWRTEIIQGVRLTKILIGPICFMCGKYNG